MRYELRSSAQLDALAAAPLPAGMRGGPARRSSHRDLYLDTPDDVLRAHGLTCRLRLDGSRRARVTLLVHGQSSVERLDAVVRVTGVTAALVAAPAIHRRLAGVVSLDALATRIELAVERRTRLVRGGLLRRPRVELHFDRVTVSRDGNAGTLYQLCLHHRRGPAEGFHRLAAALEREHGLRARGGDSRADAELLLRWSRSDAWRAASAEQDPDRDPQSTGIGAPDLPELLSPELSLLAFQRRVLALAEDPSTPLRERLRFLGILTSNLDEIYMVRMPELRVAASASSEGVDVRAADELTPGDRLARVERELASIAEVQARCAATCLREAAALGSHVLAWRDLSPDEQATLRATCRDEIYPELTPLAMTLSPGHPLPHLPHLGLSLAVIFRQAAGGESHLAEVELPRDGRRLLDVPGRARAVIPIEEVLRANVDLLYPNARVDGAYLFRVTRGGDLDLDERGADDLLTAVSDATERRPHNPAVRVEVEHAMPHAVGQLVLENLRREAAGRSVDDVAVAEVQPVHGLLDLRCLAELPLPSDPSLSFAELAAHSPLPADRSMMDAMRDGDLLVHHPFDDFEATVVRFLREAAADERVTTIKITLYRAGDPSPVVDALLAAVRAGKKVVALVELKARFDEEHNVGWARALEAAGAHVVYGFVALKVHAKVALVVRRDDAALRRYAHVGTGNYNTRSGRQYTDLSLFSASESLTSDVADLFNALTGSSRPPEGLAHGALVAPVQLLPSVLALIEREEQHARAGRPAAITIKVNGLSDSEVVHALYRAAQAGVNVELIVRGICTLRPSVAGRSERIRVVSVVGRFLEHSRIYRFQNAGDAELFIGSSDLRPRNLRRRVELLVPVRGDAHRRRLEQILALYLADRTAWVLGADGRYARTTSDGPAAQSAFAAP